MGSPGISRVSLAAGLMVWPLAAAAMAQVAPADRPDTVFVLGQLEVTARDSRGDALGGSTIGADAMRRFDRPSVDEAISLIPGANASTTGGARNERIIFVRGFDRFQTTLSIDGVRVFLPADNRIDFGRFLTADLSEVQVSKGYVSVLDGPGALGGAVNLVTRKPDRLLEAELVATATTDGDLLYDGATISALVGTRQDLFYLQASGATSERDSFSLSDDFAPTALEDGGERNNSASEDWRVNFKTGFTPNDTDEYAVSYLKQSGEKNAPYHVTDTANTRFWSWPYWDLESVYFLSRTKLNDAMTLRSRAYHNTFGNLLSAFDNGAQTTQSLPRAFNSFYDDVAFGGNVSLDWFLNPSNTLKSAVYYRKDEHSERQDGFVRTPPSPTNPSVNASYSEPRQTTEEDTWSIAIEDTQGLGPDVDLVLGASYDWTDLIEAADVNVFVAGTTIANSIITFQPVIYPTKNSEAINAQAALAWRVTDDARLHASVSSRTRFPTLFERFSSRFGTAIPNPGIDPERATNFEVGGAWDFLGLNVEGALFYSDIENALIQIPVALGPPFGNVSQTRNAADGEYYGGEIAFTGQLLETLEAGGNLTLMRRNLIDPTNPSFEPQGVPESKLFLYADWSILPNLSFTPSLEIAASRWTVTSAPVVTPPATSAALRFYETGSYGLLNLAMDWDLSDNVSILAGGKNLLDRSYFLVDGFPEEGRNFYVSVRLRN
ncbi:MAG: TonB-dependent receptor [Alphaproteobacteria bacterium]|nr:TonB-dependent receptor [Alphaproteobacteria bacterium]